MSSQPNRTPALSSHERPEDQGPAGHAGVRAITEKSLKAAVEAACRVRYPDWEAYGPGGRKVRAAEMRAELGAALAVLHATQAPRSPDGYCRASELQTLRTKNLRGGALAIHVAHERTEIYDTPVYLDLPPVVQAVGTGGAD